MAGSGSMKPMPSRPCPRDSAKARKTLIRSGFDQCGRSRRARLIFPTVSLLYQPNSGFADRVHERTAPQAASLTNRSEEHTSELQSLMRISYAVFCLKKKKKKT